MPSATACFCAIRRKIEQALRCLAMLQSKQVDGLILAPAQTDRRDIAFLQRAGIPFVLLLRYFPDLCTDFVVVDNVEAGRLMTEHLLERGHRRVGHVAGPATCPAAWGVWTAIARPSPRRMCHTMKAWCATRRLPWRAAIRRPSNCWDGLSDRPAIFAATDMQAVGVFKAAKELGLRVPDDLALAGGDDIELAEYLEVPLTSFNQPVDEIGAQIVAILLARIDGDREGVKQVVLQPQLIVRRSSG